MGRHSGEGAALFIWSGCSPPPTHQQRLANLWPYTTSHCLALFSPVTAPSSQQAKLKLSPSHFYLPCVDKNPANHDARRASVIRGMSMKNCLSLLRRPSHVCDANHFLSQPFLIQCAGTGGPGPRGDGRAT